MKLVKKTTQYSIFRRGDDRYAVKDARKKPVNGADKARILLEEDLIKATLPAKPVVEDLSAVESPADAPVGDEVADEGK